MVRNVTNPKELMEKNQKMLCTQSTLEYHK